MCCAVHYTTFEGVAFALIRPIEPSDMDSVLAIWLQASIRAHDFIDETFWHSQLDAMRSQYIPSSETYVHVTSGTINGFYSLRGESLAAVFVRPDRQGAGIGRRLIEDAKSRRTQLTLSVYAENGRAVSFYESHGFHVTRQDTCRHTGACQLIMVFPPPQHASAEICPR